MHFQLATTAPIMVSSTGAQSSTATPFFPAPTGLALQQVPSPNTEIGDALSVPGYVSS